MATRFPRHFTYRSLEDIALEIERLGLDITLERELEEVFEPVFIGGRKLGNALAFHPMEGCDGTLDGRPGDLTFRRWRRFGAGGAKLIWGEATAVVEEGRGNPRQLYLCERNLQAFAELLSATRKAHREAFGSEADLMVGIQLTHSGRYSCRRPVIACHHPYLDTITRLNKNGRGSIPPDYPLVSDDELATLEDAFVRAAELAARAGFDFIDIKQCHTYLPGELLGAKNRPGKYGGSFRNRTRFIRNVLTKISDTLGGKVILASRINAYDGVPYRRDPESGIGVPVPLSLPYHYGFGVDENDPFREDLSEPIELVRLMKNLGVRMVNVSLGSPYFNPHIGRPYERPSEGSYIAPEHPLIGVDRHFRITGAIREALPDMAIVGTGYSWLQGFLLPAAEANLRRKRVTIVGIGRAALAYPDMVRDALRGGTIDTKRVCITASFCTDLMKAKDTERGQYPTGCVPRDKLYAELYKEYLRKRT